MQRKIIQQSATSMGISLPSKWCRKWGLKKGDILEIDDSEAILAVSPAATPVSREITLTIADTAESGIRTLVINAYRAGYDKIILSYAGDKAMLSHIVDRYMLGFELFTDRNTYIIESVAEPSKDDFEKIALKQIQILMEMVRNLSSDITENFYRLRNYDNFLKRIITKYSLFSKEQGFIWQFLSTLVHIGTECFALNQHTKKFSKDELSFIAEIEQSLGLLQAAYLKKNVAFLLDLHGSEKKAAKSMALKLFKNKDPLIGYHLLTVSHQIYLSTSPLAGFIQTNTFSAPSGI